MARTSAAPSERVRLRRLHERGHYDAATIHGILDAMPICSVGYVFDGQPFVTPTLQWREGNRVYWHGSSASRMLRAAESAQVCLNVSILDGFVMARSGFHHSTNYRSVMILGCATKVTDPAAKEAHLKIFVEKLFPGRWDSLRAPSAQEMKATTILSLPLEEASAKIRTGQPVDDKEDYDLPIWAGVIPIQFQVLPPEPDPRNLDGLDLPDHIARFTFG
jgi:nitroimidazol reductase NimA-like FMN-containing flavoprotein (pyridoxamine 5'-phosphate oxidase superfamily)